MDEFKIEFEKKEKTNLKIGKEIKSTIDDDNEEKKEDINNKEKNDDINIDDKNEKKKKMKLKMKL